MNATAYNPYKSCSPCAGTGKQTQLGGNRCACGICKGLGYVLRDEPIVTTVTKRKRRKVDKPVLQVSP
jgi:hypothetical protein